MANAPDSQHVREALHALRDEIATADGVSAEIHEDGGAMTPMLSVTFDGTAERADVLRTLFHAGDILRAVN